VAVFRSRRRAVGWLAVIVVAAAIALLIVMGVARTTGTGDKSKGGRSGCEDWFSPLSVAAVCGGRMSRDFEFATGRKTGQLSTSDGRLARLFTAGPLRAGDRIALSGRATRETRLTVVLVDDDGRARFVNFDRLGLERGGTATLVVPGASSAARARLDAPGGVIAPSASYVARGYRYVTSLRVRTRGRSLVVSFRAAGSAANVYELTDEAIESDEGLYGEGEVERDAILVHREVRTSPGTMAFVRLPRRPGAFAIYVQPLSRTAVVRPAFAFVPQR
jgi:hypothetical protein